jgi:tRNA G18 (ribose-2'-O)-methylase SpoU
LKITVRNARFQELEALLVNRNKRHRAGEFVIQGVRPISVALAQGWPVSQVLVTQGPLSSWASDIAAKHPVVEVAPELMAELGGQDTAPEVLLVGRIPADDLARVDGDLVVVLDRPSSPGNLGTAIRSADAFGADGVIVTGHAADPFDPQAVRATTGSLFAVPVVRVGGVDAVAEWAAGRQLVGLDESGTAVLHEVDLRGPTALVVGNEKSGLSEAWRSACTVLARIPMGGTASSLNAASATTVALYEAARQRLG